ncbi:MAG: hypothetical protein KJ645_14130, partial [Planctomycetes bacterium]|nr:hypothetical protein [Planctomycetota bacterium]
AKTALKSFAKRLRPPPQPVEGGRGYFFEDKYRGNGRFMRAGSSLVVAMGLTGDAEKDAWRLETIEKLYDRMDEASEAKTKAEEAK